MTNIDWAKVLETVESERPAMASEWAFPSQLAAAGPATIRFVVGKETADWRDIVAPLSYEDTYKGEKSMRHVLLALMTDATNGEIRTIIMPPSVADGVLGLASAGWKVFDNGPAGVPVIVTKVTKNNRVSYTVTPAPKPMPLEQSVIDAAAGFDINERAVAYLVWKSEMAAKNAAKNA